MKVLIFTTCLIFVHAGTIPQNNDPGCKYNKEVLKNDIDRPYYLVVDIRTNILYFSDGSGDEDLGEFKSSYIDLNTNEYGEIKDVPKGFAQTVDQKAHKVYIGGSNGIYRYDHKTKKSEFIAAKDQDIWMVYAKDVLYYSVYPDQFLYVVENGVPKRFKDLEDTKVDTFIIDNEGDMFFTNHTGLYSQKKGTKDSILWSKDTIRALATDINGKAYACLQDGVYDINKKDTNLVKVVDIDDAFGLAFDNDNNIIYSDAEQVVRLTANEGDCNVVEEKFE